MNDVLESSGPFEVVAFNYASFGVFTVVVNNIWTWVAVITAAVSFWRIRTTSFSNHQHNQQQQRQPPRLDHRRKCDPHPHQPPADNTASSYVEPSPASTPGPAASVTSVSDVGDINVDGVTEGSKFTMYYNFEEETREMAMVGEWRGENGVDGDGVSFCDESPWEWRERVGMTRARVDDLMGWHRHQDLRLINGNVVRLWDE